MFQISSPSPLGPLILTSDGTFLTGLTLGDVETETSAELPLFREAVRWLNLYFSGQDPGPTPPLQLAGTPFQLAVWGMLREIPYGQSVTYGELARRLQDQGLRASAQAVGGAVGRNPLLLLIPCHRVLGRGGTLTGYAGGLDAKAQLLDLEAIPYHR